MSGSHGSLEIIQNHVVSPAVSTSNENLSSLVPNAMYPAKGKENQAPMAYMPSDSTNPKDLAPKKQNQGKRESAMIDKNQSRIHLCDIQSAANPRYCSEYASDIFQFLLKSEKSYRVDYNYM